MGQAVPTVYPVSQCYTIARVSGYSLKIQTVSNSNAFLAAQEYAWEYLVEPSYFELTVLQQM